MGVVNNDFHQPKTIFEVLADLSVKDLDKKPELSNLTANGVNGETKALN